MLCGVPRTKIYETLKKLLERGLVIEVPCNPKKFASLPPGDTFKSLRELYEKKTRGLSAMISFLEKSYMKTVDLVKTRREDVWILLGRREILQRISEMISQAEKLVHVVTTENGLILFFKVYDKLLDKLGKDGVEVQIAASIGSGNRRIAHEFRYICKVTHLQTLSSILFVSVDHSEFLLASLSPDDYSLSSEEDVGMYCRSPILCAMMHHLFLNLRDISIELSH